MSSSYTEGVIREVFYYLVPSHSLPKKLIKNTSPIPAVNASMHTLDSIYFHIFHDVSFIISPSFIDLQFFLSHISPPPPPSPFNYISTSFQKLSSFALSPFLFFHSMSDSLHIGFLYTVSKNYLKFILCTDIHEISYLKCNNDPSLSIKPLCSI